MLDLEGRRGSPGLGRAGLGCCSIPSPGGLRAPGVCLCVALGWSGDLPWLNIAAMLSSEFSLAGEFIFCKGWEANGLKTGVEMPGRCDDSLSGLTSVPSVGLGMETGKQEGCVEGLELSGARVGI